MKNVDNNDDDDYNFNGYVFFGFVKIFFLWNIEIILEFKEILVFILIGYFL